MMRSMFSGVTGLRAHQTKMDVIGNNIANVNTVGFKSGRVTFQEIFSQTIKGSSAPDDATGRGGTNPMQVGLGISVAAIDTVHTRGSLQRTDNTTDLAIDGDGFFIVRSGSADTYRFTRAGNFGIDKLGNLVTADGMNVYGWDRDSKTGEIDTQQDLEAINIYNGKRIISAKETSKAVFEGNLDSSIEVLTNADDPDDTTQKLTALAATGNTMTAFRKVERSDAETFSVPYTVYDKLGNDYTITLNFMKNQGTATSTEWLWYTIPEETHQAIVNFEYNQANGLAATNPGYKTPITDPATVTPAQGRIVFNEVGKPITVEPASTLITDNKLSTDIMVTPDQGTDDFPVSLDFSSLTQFKADSSVKATDVNGYTSGGLVNISVGQDGIITGIYSNGQMQSLGMVGLAFFENPAGLQKVGNNMFMPSSNSGEFQRAVKPGAEGTGMLSPGTLEMSNVDLSKEFTEMITTQRGFQANSRIITTSDEMLQELVNLKR
ncbi:flagellar hook protein FlgE [Petroclostridium sp. X23]|uniref:flagellar hook protein FlgE n=1 Tax=Petroclostridium sp. X23 TaxID=3045146 RepID=UPI0024AD1BF4|nr:flagellar hook protein FlgE [Petroclostridium sp. X23]WHH58939.1 flagellar hook protein FlgE [Petroclostridium sp. X23]